MPTRNINLTPQQDAFIDAAIEAGEYQNASEAVRDALRVLQQRRKEDALKLKALKASVRGGIAAIESGDFVDVAAEDLEDFLDKAAKRPARKP